eukprot:COSAG02_NODE_1250_length_13626_cov_72.701929_16_plen_141_part_00
MPARRCTLHRVDCQLHWRAPVLELSCHRNLKHRAGAATLRCLPLPITAAAQSAFHCASSVAKRARGLFMAHAPSVAHAMTLAHARSRPGGQAVGGCSRCDTGLWSREVGAVHMSSTLVEASVKSVLDEPATGTFGAGAHT